MSTDGQCTKRHRNIAENVNCMSRVQTTDGWAMTYSKREREFTFANKNDPTASDTKMVIKVRHNKMTVLAFNILSQHYNTELETYNEYKSCRSSINSAPVITDDMYRSQTLSLQFMMCHRSSTKRARTPRAINVTTEPRHSTDS